MIDPKQDILSLTEFKRRTGEVLDCLRCHGRPLVLTINGRAALVVHDVDSYEELIERIEAIEGIRRGLDQMERGKTRAAGAALAEVRRRRGISSPR